MKRWRAFKKSNTLKSKKAVEKGVPKVGKTSLGSLGGFRSALVIAQTHPLYYINVNSTII